MTLPACDRGSDKRDQGARPPPIQSSRAGVCDAGGGQVKDRVAAAFIPRTAGGYCVDPHGETRAYGADAHGTLDQVCTELFDGECEVYKSYGLERVLTLRFVDGKGSPGSVALNLSRFSSKEGAFGFYTKRVVADSDPLVAAPQVLEAGAAAALGTGIAYVFRDRYVAELSYTNELESPTELRRTSKRVLPQIAKSIGEKLPGDATLPESAERLPEQGRIPQGLAYEAADLFSISGLGSGAVGYYKEGKLRYRILCLVRPDEGSAKDVFGVFTEIDGASQVKKLGFDAVRFSLRSTEEGPKHEWLVGRRGNTLFGIGDEAYNKPDAAALSASDKLSRLRQLVLNRSAADAGVNDARAKKGSK